VRMKTIMALLFVAVLLAGCAHMTYETPDGTKVGYTRIWTSADSIEGNVGTAKVKVGGQKNNTEFLNAITALVGAAAK